MLAAMEDRLEKYLPDTTAISALLERLAGWHIHFFHEGKAPYPEIAAYRGFFGGQCSTSQGPASNVPARTNPERLIAWQIMGFYPTRPTAKVVVHDYRSLSVGRARRLKDLMKRAFNAVPHLRIYQNGEIRDALGFRKDAGHVLLPMGVPSWMFDLRWREDASEYDFGYVGVITEERGFREALRSFTTAYGGSRTWLLIGPAEPSLLEEFGAAPGLKFTGALPQRKAIELLLKARCGVALFPAHPPHCWQTPTKLLEYAALGMPVLANDSPMNEKTIEQHGIEATVRSGDLFDDTVDPSHMQANKGADFRHLDFERIIGGSGVADAICDRLPA